MIARDLIKKLRRTRGPVLVEVVNFHDTFWVQAVKFDLIMMIHDKFAPDAETGFELDKQGHFSKDYQV